MTRYLFLVAALVGASAQAQQSRVYYDYLDGGVLKGGRLVVDRTNPEHRRAFGLDRLGAQVPMVWPATTIVDNGPTSNRIDIVLLGDGYTAGELAAYAAQANNVINNFFAQEPFAAYRTYFNVHRVDVTSNESGVDEIDLGIYRDTALDMAYGCFGIGRLLCIDISKAYAAAASAPEFQQILALANSTRYGGAGYPDQNVGTLAGNNSAAIEIALHEFGHSFANLADEYDYADGATYYGPEFVEPDVSIYNAASILALSTKWFRWMDLPNVDAFQGGAYCQFGVYRPTFSSKMRSLNRPFEEVNVEQIVLSMYEIISPIDDATPSSPTPMRPDTNFYVTPLQPVDHSLSVQWSIDSAAVVGATSTTFRPADENPVPGLHNVSVAVVDNTSRIRDESLRTAFMNATRQWQISVPDCHSVVAPAAEPGGAQKARFVSVAPTNAGQRSALRVTLTSLHHPDPPYTGGVAADFSAIEGQARWVGPPAAYQEALGSPDTFMAATTQCDPYYADWSTVGLLHIEGSAIVPSSIYSIQAVIESCNPAVETNYSSPLSITTGRWGDVAEPFQAPGGPLQQPDMGDVSALVDKFKRAPGAPIKARALLVGDANGLVNMTRDLDFSHISACVDAFKGLPYPHRIAGCP